MMVENLTGRIVGGRYLVGRPMPPAGATAFRARDLERGQEVRLELFGDEELDGEGVRQFRNDARILTRVIHPNLVELLDFGQCEDGTPYVVSECSDGELLSAHLRNGPLDPDEVAQVIIQLASALMQAHQFGVFHLATTPDRVIIEQRNGAVVARLVDFMCSRWASIGGVDSRRREHRVAAPETLRGEVPTPAAEVYGLGQLAYACLVGGLPLVLNDESAARATHLSPRPWTLPPEAQVPADLKPVIEACMSKEPHKRFADCAELVAELEKWQSSIASTQRLPAVRAETGFFPKVGETFADKYVVESRIGQGAFARVFRARSLESGQTVALKILRPDRTKDSAEARRFVREGKLVFSWLTNPHTISVYGYGETAEGLLYIAFEFIDGDTLGALISRASLPATRVVRILEQTLASLAEAHGMGVLHRDIKPSNIMLSTRDGVSDWVTVVDFGVAKITSDIVDSNELTKSGNALGTPRYMSPEQIKGDPLGPESDLYSLGLVIYELLTGTQAIEGDNVLDILSAQLDPQSIILPAIASVPVPLALIVNRLMRKDRRARYANAREVLSDLLQLNRPAGTKTVDTGAP